MTEDEDFERIKHWLSIYGRWILLSLILLGLGLGGWQVWNHYRIQQEYKASNLYNHLLGAMHRKDVKAIQLDARSLKNNYAQTPYAALGQLLMAKRSVERNQLNEAASALLWVKKHASEALLRQLAILRLAQVRLAQNQPDAALALLNAKLPSAFLPMIKTLQGDAWEAKGESAKARTAYEDALAISKLNGLPTELLRWKIADLPVSAGRKS